VAFNQEHFTGVCRNGSIDTIGYPLSDRRAESVALVLSQQFGVPPENLTTQGYGAHYLKVPTPGKPSRDRAAHYATFNRPEGAGTAVAAIAVVD
jgi:hypothetical protein